MVGRVDRHLDAGDDGGAGLGCHARGGGGDGVVVDDGDVGALGELTDAVSVGELRTEQDRGERAAYSNPEPFTVMSVPPAGDP